MLYRLCKHLPLFYRCVDIDDIDSVLLASRHIRHVRTYRAKVPQDFVSQIDLAAHQKAADYTCAKTRLDYPNTLVHVLLLLLLTLGGGLNAIANFWENWLSDPVVHGMVLVISTVLLLSIAEIPFSYYRTFVIEQQFGFNKMTRTMFFTDLLKQYVLGLLLGAPLIFASYVNGKNG